MLNIKYSCSFHRFMFWHLVNSETYKLLIQKLSRPPVALLNSLQLSECVVVTGGSPHPVTYVLHTHVWFVEQLVFSKDFSDNYILMPHNY